MNNQHKEDNRLGAANDFQLRRWLPNPGRWLLWPITVMLLWNFFTLAKQWLIQWRESSGFAPRCAPHEPAPPLSGKVGRPQERERLPTLQAILESRQTKWQSVRVCAGMMGKRNDGNHFTNAVWYHSGLPPVPSAGY